MSLYCGFTMLYRGIELIEYLVLNVCPILSCFSEQIGSDEMWPFTMHDCRCCVSASLLRWNDLAAGVEVMYVEQISISLVG